MNFGLVVRDAQLGDESSTCDDDQVVLGDDPVSWVLVDPLVVLVDPLVVLVDPLVVLVDPLVVLVDPLVIVVVPLVVVVVFPGVRRAVSMLPGL